MPQKFAQWLRNGLSSDPNLKQSADKITFLDYLERLFISFNQQFGCDVTSVNGDPHKLPLFNTCISIRMFIEGMLFS